METSQEKLDKEEFRAYLRMDYPFFGIKCIDQLLFTRFFYVMNYTCGGYALYLLLTGHYSSWSLLLFNTVYCFMGSTGTTAGAHRLWTHKSYKANLPLQVLLMLMYASAAEYSIYKWVLDHRIHHKYMDTDKDPHNSKRGFWFSQGLWAIFPRHPDHWKALKSFDMPDLEKDPVVLFNSRHIAPITFFMYCAIPVYASMYFWGLPLASAFCLNCLRWVISANMTNSVNSVAHMYGYKPYNKDITPTENPFVSIITVGEGWHNFHHAFPWDYKASEFGWRINFTTMFIDFFAWIGWAYDLKTVSKEVIHEKRRRNGDRSYQKSMKQFHENTSTEEISNPELDCDATTTWGWDDESVTEEFKKMTTILKPSSRQA